LLSVFVLRAASRNAGGSRLRQLSLLDEVIEAHGELDEQLAYSSIRKFQVLEHVTRTDIYRFSLLCTIRTL